MVLEFTNCFFSNQFVNVHFLKIICIKLIKKLNNNIQTQYTKHQIKQNNKKAKKPLNNNETNKTTYENNTIKKKTNQT